MLCQKVMLDLVFHYNTVSASAAVKNRPHQGEKLRVAPGHLKLVSLWDHLTIINYCESISPAWDR